MKSLPQFFFSKQGAVAAELAREFLQFKEGDRIPRIADFASRFGFGHGTIQAAIQTLEDLDALQLEPRGHKGTTIKAIDYSVLWQATGREMVFGATALPYTSLFAGFATGLKQAFIEREIPFALSFMRGVVTRAQALKTKNNDFIVCSRLSGEKLCADDPDLEIWCGFGAGSHVSQHVLLLPPGAEQEIREGMRVCVDKESIDQHTLTMAEFGQQPVKFLNVSYMQIPVMLQSGQADAAVWNVDEITEKNLPLQSIPLRSEEAKEVLAKCTEAVIVIHKKTGIGNFLNHIIDPKEVLAVQEQVVKGKIAPSF